MLKRAGVIATGFLAFGLSISCAEEIKAPDRAAYTQWLNSSPANAAEVARFEAYLTSHKVGGVLPTEQILRNGSEWKRCQSSGFDLAPETDWPHALRTLEFIRDHVMPAVGPVEVVSGYRAPTFNTCVGGASRSAHRGFWALDLIPVETSLSRKDLIAKVCAVHRKYGRDYNTGLGFYSGVRFHIDSKSYRRWGADRKGASSPCD